MGPSLRCPCSKEEPSRNCGKNSSIIRAMTNIVITSSTSKFAYKSRIAGDDRFISPDRAGHDRIQSIQQGFSVGEFIFSTCRRFERKFLSQDIAHVDSQKN